MAQPSSTRQCSEHFDNYEGLMAGGARKTDLRGNTMKKIDCNAARECRWAAEDGKILEAMTREV